MHSLQSHFLVAGNSTFARNVKSWPQTRCKKLCKWPGEVRAKGVALQVAQDLMQALQTWERVANFLVAVSLWISHMLYIYFANIPCTLPQCTVHQFTTVSRAMFDRRCHQSLGPHWKSEPRQTDTGMGWHRGYRFDLFGNRLYMKTMKLIMNSEWLWYTGYVDSYRGHSNSNAEICQASQTSDGNLNDKFSEVQNHFAMMCNVCANHVTCLMAELEPFKWTWVNGSLDSSWHSDSRGTRCWDGWNCISEQNEWMWRETWWTHEMLGRSTKNSACRCSYSFQQISNISLSFFVSLRLSMSQGFPTMPWLNPTSRPWDGVDKAVDPTPKTQDPDARKRIKAWHMHSSQFLWIVSAHVCSAPHHTLCSSFEERETKSPVSFCLEC